MNLLPSEIAYSGKEYVDLYKEFSPTERGEAVDTAAAKDVFDPPQAKPVPQVSYRFLNPESGELDQFIALYGSRKLAAETVFQKDSCCM